MTKKPILPKDSLPKSSLSQASLSKGCLSQTSLSQSAPRSKIAYGRAQQQSGFTLIEVMVALAILAVVAVAASRASSAYLRSVDILKTRTLAHFVAQNTAADLRINQTWLSDNQTKKVSEQGREWQVVMTVGETMTPAINKVTIAVAPIVDGTVQNSVTDLTVMVSKANTASTTDLRGAGQ